MRTFSRRRCGGYTLFEAGVAACLFAVLVAVFISRVQIYLVEAERVAQQQQLGSLRTALAVRAAQAQASQGEAGLARLAEENPMDWLAGKPENYLGELNAPDAARLPAGNWYFDRSDRSLVYLPHLKKSDKSTSVAAPAFQKFKLKLGGLPSPSDSTTRSKLAPSLVLEQVTGSSDRTQQ